MPHYTVVMLASHGSEAILRTTEALDIGVCIEEQCVSVPSALKRRLAEVHTQVIVRLAGRHPGFLFDGSPPPWKAGTDVFDTALMTPWGMRCIRPIAFEVSYQPDDGDTLESAAFGVSLSSRYGPSLLDMANPHGSLEGEDEEREFSWPRDAVPWQTEAADIARELLLEAFPEMEGAILLQKREFA